jgi:hypothetical protein
MKTRQNAVYSSTYQLMIYTLNADAPIFCAAATQFG